MEFTRMTNLAESLRRQGFNIVIIRGRQYQGGAGIWKGVATEMQAVASHCAGYHGGKNGMIQLFYRNPPLGLQPPDYKKQAKLQSEIWTGDGPIEQAWLSICDSWVEVPTWLATKPVIFSRQFHLDDEYTNVEADDLWFLREMDAMLASLAQHNAYLDRHLSSVADKTPVQQRGAEYRTLLRDTANRRSLISTISHRLKTFTDQRFAELTSKLGIIQIKPEEC